MELRDRVKRLNAQLYTFSALESCSASSIDRLAFSLRSLHPERHPHLYQIVLQQYQAAAEALPAGIEGVRHRWLAAHADTDRNEASGKADIVRKVLITQRRFEQFAAVVDSTYRMERFDLDRVLSVDEPPEKQPLTTGEQRDQLLVSIFKALARFRAEERDCVDAFRQISRLLLNKGDLIDTEQQLNVYLSIRNQVAHLAKTGRPLARGLAALWPSLSYRYRLYRRQLPLPPLVVLDEYNLLLAHRSPAYAYGLLDELQSFVAAEQRDWVRLDAEVAYSFFTRNFERCRTLANHPGLQVSSSDDWRILIRRHSYRLRSSMEVYLINRADEDWQMLLTALQSFEAYMRTMPSVPHPTTKEYVHRFLKLCRRLCNLLKPDRQRVPSIKRLQKDLAAHEGRVHAAVWLEDIIDRIEDLELDGELPFSAP
jgi:hypothetical protein